MPHGQGTVRSLLHSSQVYIFFSASGLWAASAPVLALTTRYSGFSLEAATSWPLMLVCDVSFFFTVPCTVPWDECHSTLSPALNVPVMMPPRNATIMLI